MKRNRVLWIVLLVLIAALLAVLGVIVFKMQEYQASEAFYQSLRTGLLSGGRIG